MDEEFCMELLLSSIVPKSAKADGREVWQASKTPVVGNCTVSIDVEGFTLHGEPDNDIVELGYHLPGYLDQTKTMSFTRTELKESFFQHDINMIMMKARISNRCELSERYPCDECCYEGDCPGIKLTMALCSYPRELDLVEDKDIIESEEFMEGLDAVCWRIDEEIAARLLLKDEE